ncbi:MAG: hypothetical protein KGL99_07660 [Burkholderiales bacterium]|nr:hypothetical protein [Burkholderiales bacterium]
MNTTHPTRRSALAIAAALALFAAAPVAMAQAPTHKPLAKSHHKAAVAKPAEVAAPAAADADQIAAATQVYYGAYACELNDKLSVTASPKYPAYVELRHGKADYLMKPVVSSTGAIRLEDVRGEALMVQIANKSMLLNVKTSHRIVDDCVSSKQRELIEASKASKAASADLLKTNVAALPSK